MKQNPLREIEGERIRRQYFTLPVIVLGVIMLFVPYCLLVFSLRDGSFLLSDWLDSLWISFWVCFVFSLPFLILMILNRVCFGRIICVLTAEGICCKDCLIKWNEIEKIEYEIDFPSRHRIDRYRCCRAIIHTKNKSMTLLHAPLYLLRRIKRIQPDLDARISKGSKWMLGIILAVYLLLVLFAPIST